MANKRYNITQTVTFNGQKLRSSFGFYGEESELTALLGLLEGGYKVTEVNETLSDLSHEDTNVTQMRKVTKIGLTSEADANGEKTYSTIKPYRGAIMFKTTAGDQEIEGALVNAHCFPIAPTLRVAQVYANSTVEGTSSD